LSLIENTKNIRENSGLTALVLGVPREKHSAFRNYIKDGGRPSIGELTGVANKPPCGASKATMRC
jgi:hypothetical protein